MKFLPQLLCYLIDNESKEDLDALSLKYQT